MFVMLSGSLSPPHGVTSCCR